MTTPLELTINGVDMRQPGIWVVDESLVRLLAPGDRRGEIVPMPYVDGGIAFPRRRAASTFDLSMFVWGSGDTLMTRLMTLRASVFDVDLSVTPTVTATLTGLSTGTLEAEVQPANVVYAITGGGANVTFDLIVPAGAFLPA